MDTGGWHVPEEDLRGYAEGGLGPPRLWSAETHLAACAHCRERLAVLVGPQFADDGWARLDAALDAPRPGHVEKLLVRCGMAEHHARLLAATTALRRSWLVAVVVTLVVAVVATHLTRQTESPLLFLAAAPLLPLAGVAVSFGPGIDPAYEMTLVSPMHTFRLLMLRTAAVLATTTAFSGLAALAVPGFGPVTAGWLLPALALTSTSLALASRLGPVVAPAAVGAGWVVALAFTSSWREGESLLFGPAGQAAAAVAAVAATAATLALRHRFDSSRLFTTSLPFTARRLS